MHSAASNGPQLPFREVTYNRNEYRPAPLSCAPNLVNNASDAVNQEMIYVHCDFGTGMTEMMVDTGAQMSVMSTPLVYEFGLQDHVDTRRRGIASGVGHAKILGVLHGVPVRLGTNSGVEFALDFHVLGVDQELLMLGIDQLRRFECIIDLKKQVLVFGGHGGTEVAFLPPSPKRLHWRVVCPQM